MAAGVLALTAVHWTPTLHLMMTVRQEPALRSATRWAGAHIPRESVLVVHDTIWVDLVHHYGFSSPRPIIAHKLDNDPAIRENLTRLDYLIVPTWYYATDTTQYPTLVEARRHAVAVATFGEGDDGVRIYRVSRYWEP